MAKKALIVGINAYPTAPLRGCVNDAIMVSEMLTEQFGFSAVEKRLLTDESATTANILERLNWLVKGAKAGDTLFFHFSGHGSQMIDRSDKEPDGLDEILCPVDLDWRTKVITDSQLKSIFDKVPAGVELTVVMDCCHSGTMLDQAHQYQPLGVATRSLLNEFGPDSPNRSRYLPMPTDIEHRGIGLNLKPRDRSVQHRHVDKTGLMVTGCQSHQTSADAFIDNQYCGAATYSLIKTLRESDFDLDYKTLVDKMNNFMVERRFTQRPELNGNPGLHGGKFLGGKKPEGAVDTSQESTVPDYVDEPENSVVETVGDTITNVVGNIKKINPVWIIVGAIVVAMGIAIFMGMS